MFALLGTQFTHQFYDLSRFSTTFSQFREKVIVSFTGVFGSAEGIMKFAFWSVKITMWKGCCFNERKTFRAINIYRFF